MKLPFTICDLRFAIWKKSTESAAVNRQSSIINHKSSSGFTMVEIALSLAIMGIALVGILAVLPLGLNVQRDNREATIINQDATIFMEAIRNGSRGADDLTNYVYEITNSVPGGVGYVGNNLNNLNTGARIIGLLSTPKYQHLTRGANTSTNRIVAYVHSLSGPAMEKPPQDNQLLVGDSFGYRIICDNMPVETDPNAPSLYSTNLNANLHELRLTFLWPQLPNGKLGRGHQTFRTLIAGQLVQTNDAVGTLYFYQPQSFTNAP